MQHRPMPLDVFVGRSAEVARITEVITRVQAGEPWLVAIEGDPGIGKTALVRHCLARAADLKVLSARADPGETDLDLGIVDQLLRAAGGLSAPVLAEAGTGGTAPPVSSFAAGARLLEVVGGQQSAGAVAIVVDDLQWADHMSVEALTFTLRRLSVDPVLAIVIYRGTGDRLDETARRLLVSVENQLRISLDGLGVQDVAALAAELEDGVAGRRCRPVALQPHRRARTVPAHGTQRGVRLRSTIAKARRAARVAGGGHR